MDNNEVDSMLHALVKDLFRRREELGRLEELLGRLLLLRRDGTKSL